MAVEQAEVDPAKVDELMGRLIHDFAGAGSIPLTLIGLRTGLWRAMAGAGPLTPAEVAARSGTAERYVVEWLKAQAAGGYVAYHPDSGRFSLPAEAAAELDRAELEAELEEADANADPHRAERARMERDALVEELTRAAGLGGRPRRLGDDTERARKAVTARVRDAIARVGRQHPALGRHLTDTVSTGTWCAYTPPTPVAWEL